MSKVQPSDSKEKEKKKDSDSDSDGEKEKSDSEEEDESKQPVVQYDVGKIDGYEKAKFGAEEKITAPKGKELSGEKPPMPYQELSEIKESECRDAMLSHVAQNCCWGKGPAVDMKYDKISPNTAFHYILETYAEKRTTSMKDVPYKGEIIDGPDNGPAPQAWDIPCTAKEFFKDQINLFEVPHTSVVKPCQRCAATGMVTCGRCHGRCTLRCNACYGRGRRRVRTENGYTYRRCWVCGGDGRITCFRCGGCGKVTCPKCEGFREVRCYVQLRVKFKNHKSDYILETTDLPDQLIKKVSGECAFKQELDLVWPMTDYPVKEVNDNSQRLLKKHGTDYKDERVLQQRQTLRAVAVAQVDYEYKDKKGTFFVYGNERKVYSPDYPATCCWGCQVL